MMMKFGSKTQQAVGLDIGTYSIKVVSMESTDHGSMLTSYNIKKIPADAKSADLRKIVKESLSEIDLEPEDLNLGFSGPGVIVRFIDLPKMTKDQLEGALSFEAEKYIPFNANEVVMDFLILGDSSEKGKMRVLLAAAKKDLLEERLRLMKELDININVMDIDSLAVFNAFDNVNPGDDSSRAFFHFGYSQANVLVTVGDTPCFIRQIQIGGRDIEAAIVKDKGGSQDEAEEIIGAVGEKSMGEDDLPTTFSILDDIARELQLSFGYFENRYNTKVSEVYCSGGMSFQENILKYLAEKAGFEMKVWSPIKGMKLADHLSREDIDGLGPLLTVATGLALRR